MLDERKEVEYHVYTSCFSNRVDIVSSELLARLATDHAAGAQYDEECSFESGALASGIQCRTEAVGRVGHIISAQCTGAIHS